MKLKYLSLIALMMAFATSVNAENYAGLGYGRSWNGGHAYRDGHKYDTETFSNVWSLFLGKTIPTEWCDVHAEAEVIHIGADTDYGEKLTLNALMANATAVIPDTGWFAEPYAGLGVGMARFDHNNTIAWQFIGGLEYNFEQYPIGTALEYRHLLLNEHGGKGADTSRFNSDTLMLKLKYFF